MLAHFMSYIMVAVLQKSGLYSYMYMLIYCFHYLVKHKKITEYK